MNILLNTIVFTAFMWWFWQQFVVSRKKVFIGTILLFLLASLLLFVFSLFTQNDYLDGLHYILVGGISITAFWLSTTALIFWKNTTEKTTHRTVSDLLQNIPLLLIPLLIWLLLSNTSFKIGG